MSSIHSQHSSRVQTAHRQTAYALNTNAEAFISHYGIDYCAFWTLTFQNRLYPIPAKNKMRKALRLFQRHFEDWMFTMGLSPNRRIHYHALVACKDNLREGIDLSQYPRLLELQDNSLPCFSPVPVAEQKAALRKALSSNAALLQLRRDIYPCLHKLGFGQQLDLSPILSHGPAIAAYLEDNYLDTVRRKDFLFRGVRLTGYKLGGHRVCRTPFAWVSSHRRRLAIRIVARALGVTEYTDMKWTFGPKWGYLSNLLILDLVSHHGRDPHHWPSSEIHRLALEEGMMPFVT